MSTPKTRTAYVLIPVALATALMLGGCGNTRGERALSGGAIGAATGAAGAAIIGGGVAGGALLGGAAGAAIGAITDRDDIDLGDIE